MVIDDVALIREVDRQRSFMGNKRRQHWLLWYAFETKRRKDVAHVFSQRTKRTLKRLLNLLKKFSIGLFTTDYWRGYEYLIHKCNHLTGKIFPQRIERNSLTLKTCTKCLASKTFCFSKLVDVYEKVTGTFL